MAQAARLSSFCCAGAAASDRLKDRGELYAVEGGLTVLCKDPVVIWSSSMKDRSPVRMLDTVHMGFHDSCSIAASHI